MNYFEEIAKNPILIILSVLLAIYALIEIFKIVKFFKELLNKYHDKATEKENVDQSIKDHSDALKEINNSINRMNQSIKALKDDFKNDIQEVRNDIEELSTRHQNYENLDEEREADKARSNILRFADELRLGVKHSLEMFNQILSDIKFYKVYCDNHPNYENMKAESAIEKITEVYKECDKNNDFL